LGSRILTHGGADPEDAVALRDGDGDGDGAAAAVVLAVRARAPARLAGRAVCLLDQDGEPSGLLALGMVAHPRPDVHLRLR
jgi:hypothetical protein